MTDYLNTSAHSPISELKEPEAPQEDSQKLLNELSRQGYQQLKAGNCSEANKCFMHILELDPNNNYALVGMGDSYRKKMRFQEASTYYQQCLNFNPENNYALFGLADCYRSLKQFHRAIDVWEKYLKLDDKNVTVLTRVADAYRKVRNLERSCELYHQVLELEENNAYAIIGLGHLYYDFKDFPKALHFWERMYEISGSRVDIRVLTSLGNCHRKMKTFSQGLGYFEQALTQDTGNFYALFGLADCYRGMNQQLKSLEYWNRILLKDPGNKVILTRAGDAYRKIGNFELAKDYYNRALNVEYDVYAILGLALINKNEKQYSQAVRSLETILESDKQMQRLYPEILDCYVHLNDQNGIRDINQRFHMLRPLNPHIQEQFNSLLKNNGTARLA